MNHELAAHNEARLPGLHGPRTPARTDRRFFVRYHTLLMAIALGAMYANLPIYLYILDARLLPKFIYFGIFGLIAPLMVIRWQAFRDYLVSPFALWALLLFSLNMIHLAGFPASVDVAGAAFMDMQAEARRSMIATRAQYILFALFLGFVAYISPTRMYLRIMFVLMAVVPCAVIVDFANPGLLYPVDLTGAVLGRAAAMFINPNIAGEAILHIVVLGFAVLDRRCRMPVFLLAGVAILTTFSRAAIIAWLVLLGLFIYKKTLPKSAAISLTIAIGILLVFIGSFESYISSREEFEDAATNILSRLNFFSSFTFDDDSSEERAGVIQAGWELFLQNPLFGSGAGATHFWRHRGSTHNQLLLLAAEYGVMGILLWGWMLIMLCKSSFFSDRGLRYAMAFLFAFMSMFTHQMFDAASYWLVTFALVCAMPGSAPAGPLPPWPRQRMARLR
jgi:O-antigen ligase